MPRKSTRKTASADVKNEEVAPRRSGRAATKQDTHAEKDSSRSRRSSTAAQTAASVADSKPVKVRGDASSAADSRTRGGKENAETAATRATRRSTGRINYKESDGEEETPTPKYDKNFESGEECEDSESDEKSKQQGRNKPTRASKGRAVKEQVEKSAQVRRGRPSKRKSDPKTVDISDDSMEPEIIETKSEKKTPDSKSKPQSKRTRGSKTKSEVVDVELENDPKPSRRSARAASVKEESPKKRPSRGGRAKQYTEEIEEIIDDESVEVEKKSNSESGRKRKRNSSVQDSNKRSRRNDKKSIQDAEVDEERDKEIDEDTGVIKDDSSEVIKKISEKDNSEVQDLEGTEVKKEDTKDKIENIDDKMEDTVDKMEETEDKMEGTGNKMESTENKMEGSEDKMEDVEDKMEVSENKIEGSENEIESSESKIKDAKDKRDGDEDKIEDTEEKMEGTEDKVEGIENKIEGTGDSLRSRDDKLKSTQMEKDNNSEIKERKCFQDKNETTPDKVEYTRNRLESCNDQFVNTPKKNEITKEKKEMVDEVKVSDNKTNQDKIAGSVNYTESPKVLTEITEVTDDITEDNINNVQEKNICEGKDSITEKVEQNLMESIEKKENVQEELEEEPMEVDESDSNLSSQDTLNVTRPKDSDISEDKENLTENVQENIPPSDEVEEIICEASVSPKKHSAKLETKDQTNSQLSEPIISPSGLFSNSEFSSTKIEQAPVSHISSISERAMDDKAYPPIQSVRTASEESQPSAITSEIKLQSEKNKFETNTSETSLKEPKVEKIESSSLPSVQNIQTDCANNSGSASGLSFNGTAKSSNSVDSASISVASICDEKKEISVPTTNGAHEDVLSNEKQLNHTFYSLPDRKFVCNPKINENVLQSIKNKTFGFLSYNLGSESGVQKDKLLKEIHDLNSHIICFQQVPKPFYSSVLEPTLDALGYKSIYSQPADSLRGIATFFKNSYFSLNGHFDISLRQVIDKELEASSLESISKAAVKSFVKRCGNALLTQFIPVNGSQSVSVVNVQIPPSDIGLHALQVSCLAREIIKLTGSANKPLLVGGEFNISQNEASYQLLRDGYLANEMIDELQKRKDISVPEKENSSLVDLLWKSFQHPSSNLCSCYSSVLGHEVFIPNLKKSSPDLLWYSSDSLLTVGVVDVNSEKLNDCHVSLKADIAFTN